MPEISRFYGIVIQMFAEAGAKHQRPHFHAKYNDSTAVFAIDTLEHRINFLPVLEGALYGPLKDRALFDAVSIDEDFHTLVWPNGADFDPANLHDWPEVEAEFVARAKEWAAQ